MDAHVHTHDHDHAGEAVREYYVEQLANILFSGAFGATGILMYFNGMLVHILAEPFRFPVLLGGIGLLTLAVFRGAALWFAVGGDHFHDHHLHVGHAHAPGESCDHTEDDDHEGEHAHGVSYWKLVLLAFPVCLFVMGVPNTGMGEDWVNKKLKTNGSIGTLAEVADKGGAVNEFDFATLSLAGASPEEREARTGTTAKVAGQLLRVPGSPNEFSLYYLKMTCCATDMVPLKARVVVNSASKADAYATQFPPQSWVEVTGTLQFVPDRQGSYITVLRVKENGGIVPTTPRQ